MIVDVASKAPQTTNLFGYDHYLLNLITQYRIYYNEPQPYKGKAKLLKQPVKSNEVTTHSKPENENKPIVESLENNEGVNLDFICTINTTAVKEFSTTNPEKPANYFHLISIEPQTICTVDNLGNKKTYRLEEGGKVTHRGEPPFKIQLDPNKSRLYFQGWIVHLQPQDRFIQLNAKELIDFSN